MDTEKLIEAFTVAITAAIEEMGWENFKEIDWFKYDNVGLWCNGNTQGFDPCIPGSSPGGPSKYSGVINE